MVRRSMRIAALLAAVISSPAHAQGASGPPGFYVSGGLFVAGSLWGLAAMSVSSASGDFVARVTEESDFELFGGPSATTSDVALLYGRRARTTRSWIRGSLGLGLATHTEKETERFCQALFHCVTEVTEVRRSRAVGLALQGDWVWTPSESGGFGVTAFANLNGDRTFGGFTLTLHLGRVR